MGLKRNHAVNPMLRHHHCLVLVESSDFTVTKDRKIGCAGDKSQPATPTARALAPNRILGRSAFHEDPELALPHIVLT